MREEGAELVCRGEERAEHESKAVDLPNLTYSHKFWVETERIDSNEIEFLLKDVWAQPWRESAELGCSGGAQNTHSSSLKRASWGGGLCDHFGADP